ncbi:hypothetical protein ARMSODRAFT_603220 [Armillaria solidipes]|uniref:Uncharacterized protein n=1 Tax=Armillaria solidipes TaxID=1076256 RepID=A0A2H3B929_9AGAR|nr:hypothetical protein ARMSODRAFT_603220 [Armillaria solidipes]
MDIDVILSMFERRDPLDRPHLARLSKAFRCILMSHGSFPACNSAMRNICGSPCLCMAYLSLLGPIWLLSRSANSTMRHQQIRRNFFSGCAYAPHVSHYICSPLLILNALLDVSELMRGAASSNPHSNIALKSVLQFSSRCAVP